MVHLLDDERTVRRKIARAVTDSDTGPGAVRHDREAKPEVSIEVVAACEGVGVDAAAAGCTSYGDLKQRATEAVLGVLRPLQGGTPARGLARRGGAGLRGGRGACRAETAPVLAAAREAIGLT